MIEEEWNPTQTKIEHAIFEERSRQHVSCHADYAASVQRDQPAMAEFCARVVLCAVTSCILGLLLLSTDAFSNSGKIVRVTFRAMAAGTQLNMASSKQEPSAPDPPIGGIPKVLHHVYLDGLDNLQQAESLQSPKPGERFPGYNSTWWQSCTIVHPGWQHMFWNNSQAERLIRTKYPQFLATFQSYNNKVQKGERKQFCICS